MVAAFLDTQPFGLGVGTDGVGRDGDSPFDDDFFDDDFFDATAFAGPARAEWVASGTRVASATRRSRGARPVTPVEYRHRRTVAIGLVVAILLGLFMALQALLGRSVGGPLASVGSPGSAQPAVARIWVVHPGDTLWTIALASGARGDIRPLVDKMSAEVGGKPLQPGERILVP
jgi:hypothetical protein